MKPSRTKNSQLAALHSGPTLQETTGLVGPADLGIALVRLTVSRPCFRSGPAGPPAVTAACSVKAIPVPTLLRGVRARGRVRK